jgi:hypothetical protein
MASESGLISSNAYLEDVPEVEATFRFTDSDSLRRTLREFSYTTRDRDELSDKTVLVTEFPPESFIIDSDEEYEESPIPKSYKALYLEDVRILVLVMRGLPHEVASQHFGVKLGIKLNGMNCLEEIILTGGATCALRGVRKEPDGSWGPRGKEYSTCVLESGVSESNRSLQRDARIWLEHEESHVSQVVTIKIHRVRPEIVFSVWKATEEEISTQRRSFSEQEVLVTLTHGRLTADGRLCLSFEELFERPPRPGTRECDIVFSPGELGGIARVVWEEMDLYSDDNHRIL